MEVGLVDSMITVHLLGFTPIPLPSTLAFDSRNGVEGHDGMAAGD
jgi:hypothetical protein